MAKEKGEAAGAQVVKRGQQVVLEEIPDEEDDASYRQWKARGSPIISSGVPQARPQENPKMIPTAPKVAFGWVKPFEVDWTLCVICEAWNDNTARAVLSLWMHPKRLRES